MSTESHTFESSEARKTLSQVLAIIQEHGSEGIPRWKIVADSRINTHMVYVYCVELQKRGLVHTKRFRTGAVWRAGPNPRPTPKQRERAEFGPKGAMPKQTTVSTWTPHHERDVLVSALFGKSVAEKREQGGEYV